jgi:hypothetical protein
MDRVGFGFRFRSHTLAHEQIIYLIKVKFAKFYIDIMYLYQQNQHY